MIKVFENEMEGASIFDPREIVFAFDHNFAPATRDAAEALAADAPVRGQTQDQEPVRRRMRQHLIASSWKRASLRPA